MNMTRTITQNFSARYPYENIQAYRKIYIKQEEIRKINKGTQQIKI